MANRNSRLLSRWTLAMVALVPYLLCVVTPPTQAATLVGTFYASDTIGGSFAGPTEHFTTFDGAHFVDFDDWGIQLDTRAIVTFDLTTEFQTGNPFSAQLRFDTQSIGDGLFTTQGGFDGINSGTVIPPPFLGDITSFQPGAAPLGTFDPTFYNLGAPETLFGYTVPSALTTQIIDVDVTNFFHDDNGTPGFIGDDSGNVGYNFSIAGTEFVDRGSFNIIGPVFLDVTFNEAPEITDTPTPIVIQEGTTFDSGTLPFPTGMILDADDFTATDADGDPLVFSVERFVNGTGQGDIAMSSPAGVIGPAASPIDATIDATIVFADDSDLNQLQFSVSDLDGPGGPIKTTESTGLITVDVRNVAPELGEILVDNPFVRAGSNTETTNILVQDIAEPGADDVTVTFREGATATPGTGAALPGTVTASGPGTSLSALKTSVTVDASGASPGDSILYSATGVDDDGGIATFSGTFTNASIDVVGPEVEVTYSGADSGTATPGANTLDFGSVTVGDTSSITLDIANLIADNALTSLDDLAFTTDDGSLTSVFSVGPTGGDGVVNPGETGTFVDLVFTPDSDAMFTGSIFAINTDQGAPGGAGDTGNGVAFQFNLSGQGVAAASTPEPTTIMLWGLLGLIGGAFHLVRRRRRQAA